jgi:hypothetical protein
MITNLQKIQVLNSSVAFLQEHQGKPQSRMPWSALQKSLAKYGLNPVEPFLSLLFHSQTNPPSKLVRVLHELEKTMITTEAYGLLIEFLRLGLLGAAESEELLEKIVQQGLLPIDNDMLKNALMDFLLAKVKTSGKIH